MAALLTQVGLQPGDRVAVQADKTVAMLELYVGTVLAGGVFLPLNPAYTPAEIEYFLSRCDTARISSATLRDLTRWSRLQARAGVTKVLTLAGDESGTLTGLRDSRVTSPGFVAVPSGARAIWRRSFTRPEPLAGRKGRC